MLFHLEYFIFSNYHKELASFRPTDAYYTIYPSSSIGTILHYLLFLLTPNSQCQPQSDHRACLPQSLKGSHQNVTMVSRSYNPVQAFYSTPPITTTLFRYLLESILIILTGFKGRKGRASQRGPKDPPNDPGMFLPSSCEYPQVLN